MTSPIVTASQRPSRPASPAARFAAQADAQAAHVVMEVYARAPRRGLSRRELPAARFDAIDGAFGRRDGRVDGQELQAAIGRLGRVDPRARAALIARVDRFRWRYVEEQVFRRTWVKSPLVLAGATTVAVAGVAAIAGATLGPALLAGATVGLLMAYNQAYRPWRVSRERWAAERDAVRAMLGHALSR